MALIHQQSVNESNTKHLSLLVKYSQSLHNAELSLSFTSNCE